MSNRKRRRSPHFKPARAVRNSGESTGFDAADAITVAWTVSVTAVFMADLVTVASHIYWRWHPESATAAAFTAIILLSACVIGLVSLVLLLVTWRVRRVRPPVGFAVFAGSVAAAPVLAVAIRLWT